MSGLRRGSGGGRRDARRSRPRRPGMLALLGALFCLAAAAAYGEPSVVSPAQVVQGRAFSVVLSDAPGIAGGDATLALASGEGVDSAPLFPLDASEGRWMALLGVPTTLPPGQYTLQLDTRGAKGSFHLASTLTVVAGTFAHEEIPLDKSLTELREEPNPEKDAQARELWDIITTFNLGDLYQKGDFSDPLKSWIVTSPYGERRVFLYSDGSKAASVHYGIDMAAPLGAPISAAGKGRVVFAGSWILTGNTVVIEHLPGVYSMYFHLSELLVKAGEMVEQGQEIGKVGMTGLATGPHLHWEITVAGVPVSPDQLVRAGLIDKSLASDTMSNLRP